MALNVKGKTIATDEEGYLLNPDDWDESVMDALIAEHEKAGHKPLSETAKGLVEFVREYYEEHQTHPDMHQLVNELGRHPGESFHEAEGYKKFLFDMFPHGPVAMLAKLAGLPLPREEAAG